MNASKNQKAWMIVLCVALAAMGCTESTPAPPVPPAPTPASTAASQPLPSGTVGANL